MPDLSPEEREALNRVGAAWLYGEAQDDDALPHPRPTGADHRGGDLMDRIVKAMYGGAIGTALVVFTAIVSHAVATAALRDGWVAVWAVTVVWFVMTLACYALEET